MKRHLAAFVLAIAAIAAPQLLVPYTPVLRAQQEEPGSPRSRAAVTFLQLNDVYSTVPIDDEGGLARVATLKQRFKDQGRTPFLVLAGDFLSPSVASSVFKGEQMIAAFNAAGLDLATLGNHEFDFGDDVLIERMKEAKWQWVVSNVVDRRTGRPIGGAAPYVLRTFGTLKVGFIGLCLTSGEISKSTLTHTRLVDPIAAAARYIPVLKRQRAQVIVAVTHLDFATDRRLVARFPEIDLVIGGHEHYPITATERGALISKAGSDARYIARIDVGLTPIGTDGAGRAGGAGQAGEARPATIAQASRRLVERFFELIPVTSEIPDDPKTAEVVASYEAKLGTALDVVVGATSVPLDAQSVRLRASEQAIGNLFADALRADAGTDVAFMNAGSIRGDRIYPAGPLTRRTLIAMHPFGNVITTVAVPGRVLLSALNSGVSKLPASAGQFPQVSGMTMAVNVGAPAGSRVHDVKVGGQPLDPAKIYTVAMPDYVLKGGDEYGMFAGQKVLVGPEAGDLLVTALEKYVAEHKTVSPRIEGRIVITR